MPRLLNLVPALRHDSRDMSVKDEGRPILDVLTGAEEGGIVIVRTKPRIAEVRSPELSRAALSRATSRLRNFTRGPIMYEFHRKD
jgi:hypothetical protein